MFKPTKAKTPTEYLKMIEDDARRKEVKEIFQFIKKTIPELKPYIISGMIGFGTYHYKYASGKEGDWMIIALASQKSYISVYACATDKNDKYLAEKYANQLGKVNVGKSCIRFKKVEDLDLIILKKVLLESVKLMNKK